MRLSAVKGVARLYNALIEALNAQKFRLPKYIVMVPDKDLIEQINFYSFGASTVISAALQWLVHQMELTIEQKEEKIIEKRPGALPPKQTKFVWVKMLRRPQDVTPDVAKSLALRNRFNNALEDVLGQDSKYPHYILSIKAEERDFYINGMLTDPGQRNFWREVDLCMKKFDRDAINLKPRPSTDGGNNPKCRKLPTPPTSYQCYNFNRECRKDTDRY